MTLRFTIAAAVLLIFGQFSLAQGTFQNLDFESANVSGFSPGPVPATNAIPGWTAYIAGVPQSSVLYNDQNLGEAAISLQGTNGPYQPIQGKYFVLLQATFLSPQTNTAAIGQIGQIPATAESLLFWGNTSLSGLSSDMRITFNGVTVPYSQVSRGSAYSVYAADISGFAGQTGQLLFTAFNNTYAAIDNIQFSNLPIPEPSTFAFICTGALMLCTRGRRNSPQ